MKLPENAFKRGLDAGRQQIGLWVTIPDPSVVEALAGAGYDWLLLDSEHTPVEAAQILPLLQATAAYPVSTLVRPAANDTVLIKRYLDMGAQTLLLPYIQSRAEAEAAVAAVRYAPEGVRGVSGIMRASRFGRVDGYLKQAAREICLVLQIETRRGLDNLEEIASVDGVDGIFIGPADLSTSMGYAGDSAHPKVIAAIEDAIARLKAIAKPSGILTLDPAFAHHCINLGTTFTGVGVDLGLLVRAADDLAGSFKA